MELKGVEVHGGSVDEMAECIVEEFVLQGFPDDVILMLFQRPQYAATHMVFRLKGEAYVKDVIARVRARFGEVRFRTEDGNA